MTTTAAGDAAVARLNKATEALEKIITGDSNQVVDVPGYGNQPTLAARVDEQLDETTATAAAEANRSRDEADRATAQATAAANSVTLATAEYSKARIQADRAQSEADRASQISGLDTVADAIGLAALPLPDVWAPLSNSLRLITGYGRDVLAGSGADVVAQMVNFSRNSTAAYVGKDGQWKTAAVNEVRFEKEGLLGDVQSTNLFAWSQEFIGKWIRVDGTASPDAIFPNAIALNDAGLGYVHMGAGNLTIGAPYTISAIVKGYVPGVTDIKGIFAKSGQDTAKVVGQVGAYTILSFTKNSALNTNPDVTGLTWAAGKASGVVLCAMQIEPLPFASSYIPTNGSSVTRAPDVAYLPSAGNRFFFAGFTVAFEWDLLGIHNNIADNRLIDLDNDASSNRHYVGVDQNKRLVAMFGTNKIVSPSSTLSGLCVLVVNGNSFSLYNNGTKIGTAAVTGRAAAANGKIGLLCNNIGVFPSSGHLRNLRIWHRALSEAQIKAIA